MCFSSLISSGFFFFSSRRRHTRFDCDWSSDECSSDLFQKMPPMIAGANCATAGEAYALVSIGLISFSAVAQFAPAIIGGIFWKGGTRTAAFCGLAAGFLVWTYTLLLPSFAKSGWLPITFLSHGLFGTDLLKPQQLLGLQGLGDITHCLL